MVAGRSRVCGVRVARGWRMCGSLLRRSCLKSSACGACVCLCCSWRCLLTLAAVCAVSCQFAGAAQGGCSFRCFCMRCLSQLLPSPLQCFPAVTHFFATLLLDEGTSRIIPPQEPNGILCSLSRVLLPANGNGKCNCIFYKFRFKNLILQILLSVESCF